MTYDVFWMKKTNIQPLSCLPKVLTDMVIKGIVICDAGIVNPPSVNIQKFPGVEKKGKTFSKLPHPTLY